MKKFVSGLLILLTALSFTACGDTAKKEKPNDNPTLPYEVDLESEESLSAIENTSDHIQYAVEPIGAETQDYTGKSIDKNELALKFSAQEASPPGAPMPCLKIGGDDWKDYTMSFDFLMGDARYVSFNLYGKTNTKEAPDYFDTDKVYYWFRLTDDGKISLETTAMVDSYYIQNQNGGDLILENFNPRVWNSFKLTSTKGALVLFINEVRIGELYKLPENSKGKALLEGDADCMFKNIRFYENKEESVESITVMTPGDSKPRPGNISDEQKNELDKTADEYLTALKEKDFTKYFGATLADEKSARDKVLEYLRLVEFEDITRSEGVVNTSDSRGYERTYAEYEVTVNVSRSTVQDLFPVGEKKWILQVTAGGNKETGIEFFPKEKAPYRNCVTYSSAILPKDVMMCYNFSNSFGVYEDVEDVSLLYDRYNELNIDSPDKKGRFYDSLVMFLQRSGVEVKTEKDFYDGAEKLLGLKGLDLNEYYRYKEKGEYALVPRPAGTSWVYCDLYTVAVSETEKGFLNVVVLTYYADSTYLIPAKTILYELKKTDDGFKIVTVDLVSDTGCKVAVGTT